MQPDCPLESHSTVAPSTIYDNTFYNSAPVNPGLPAAYFLLGFVLALTVFELWALATGHNTVSQLLQHAMRDHPHWFWVAVVGWAVLGYHLLRGFPW